MPVKADTSVKWFTSDMANGPVLRGEVGAMIELLDACLINGFDPRTPDSIVVAGEVATVNISAGNPFEQHAVIEISGATPAGLNDEWRIATVTANSFTFICPGIADGTATGTISVKRASAGWVKPFADTNKATYKSASLLSSGVCLRIDDTDARFPLVRGYESMVDIDTGTNPFPTVAQVSEIDYSWMKSNLASEASRQWLIVADGLFFWIMIYSYPDIAAPIHMFGDFPAFDANTQYPVMLRAFMDGVNAFPWKSGGASTPPSIDSGLYRPRGYASNDYAPSQARLFSAWESALTPPEGTLQSPAYPAYIADGDTTSSRTAGTSPGIHYVTDIRTDWVPLSVVNSGARAFLRGEYIRSSTQLDTYVLLDITGPWR